MTRPKSTPETDPELLAAAERVALATERDYRRLAAGTLRHKPVTAERLARIFHGIAADLVAKGAAFACPPPLASDDD